MREIKFDFIYKGDFQFHHKVYALDTLLSMKLSDLSDVHEQMPLIAKRQYTGLSDKSGKEIYEGDIIRFVSPNNIHTERTTENLVIGKVSWFQHAQFMVVYKEKGQEYCSGFDRFRPTENKVEVIGNVCESPELLEVN